MLLYGYAFVCECMWKDAKDNHGKDLETKDPRTRTELVNVFSGTSGSCDLVKKEINLAPNTDIISQKP